MTDSKDKSESTESPVPLEGMFNWAAEHPKTIISTLLVFAILPFLYSPLVQPWFREGEWRILNPNEVGDTFGFLNSLMSSLAFLAVLVTLSIQRKELKLQHEEMRNSRDELKKTAEAQRELVNLQLTQSYISAITVAINYHDGERRASRPGQINLSGREHELFDGTTIKELASTLSWMLRRWEPAVKDIAGNQPLDLEVFLEKLISDYSEIIAYLKVNDIKRASELSRSVCVELKWWTPRLKTIDHELYSLVRLEIMNFLQIMPELVKVAPDRIREYCDGMEEHLKKLTAIETYKYMDRPDQVI